MILTFYTTLLLVRIWIVIPEPPIQAPKPRWEWTADVRKRKRWW